MSLINRIQQAFKLRPNVVAVVLNHTRHRELCEAHAGVCDGIYGVPLVAANVRRDYVVYENYDGPMIEFL